MPEIVRKFRPESKTTALSLQVAARLMVNTVNDKRSWHVRITTAPVADGAMGVCVAGEVDMETAGQVADAVRAALAAAPREVHVDMAAVTFLDSSGIRMLLLAQREAAEQQIVLRVVDAHRRVVKVLELTGLLDRSPGG